MNLQDDNQDLSYANGEFLERIKDQFKDGKGKALIDKVDTILKVASGTVTQVNKNYINNEEKLQQQTEAIEKKKIAEKKANNYFLYGGIAVGVLMVVVVIIALLKKKK